MQFRDIQFAYFRNFSQLELSLSPGLNVFLGDNGQGKTNLLEGLCILAHGDTFRAKDSGNLVHSSVVERGAKAVLAGKIQKQGLDFEVRVVIDGGKKTAEVNHKPTTSVRQTQLFPMILFSPESLATVKEGPEQRRQLIDDFLVLDDPHKVTLFREFRKILRTRNQLLKDFAAGQLDKQEFSHLKGSLDETYLRVATTLTMARLRILRDIKRGVAEVLSQVMEQSVQFDLSYRISGDESMEWGSEQTYNTMRERMEELAAAELSYGRSLVGPQKHQIHFIYDGKDSRFYCSQGQQRAIILSFKMAQMAHHKQVHGEYPALLLDDVLSELDTVRRSLFIEFLRNIEAQVILTTTDLQTSKSLIHRQMTVFNLSNGHVTVQ